MTRSPGALDEVFRLFLKFGIIGFGGPVRRRRRIRDERFLDLFGGGLAVLLREGRRLTATAIAPLTLTLGAPAVAQAAIAGAAASLRTLFLTFLGSSANAKMQLLALSAIVVET